MSEHEKFTCIDCQKRGITAVYLSRQALSRHRRNRHTFSDTTHELQLMKKKLERLEQLEKKEETITQILETVTELKNKINTAPTPPPVIPQVTNNINNNITNNINIYFNKDLKYYPELVKLLGRQKTCDYLLFKMPESRDLFGVLDTLFVKDGVSTCPIKVGDDDEFVVARNNDEYIHDPTGELIDRENKSKLQDAILSAYIDSTKHLDDECEKIRKDRVNGEYTEQDKETINKRFDSAIEPSRPYEVIDIMNGIKPKKKDFDRLRKICPKVVKKIVV